MKPQEEPAATPAAAFAVDAIPAAASMPPATMANGGGGLYTGQVQILLAEKRTSLALLRTGIAVALVPLSIWTVLIATSRMWDVFSVLPLLLPVLVIALLLFGVGVHLVVHSIRHLAHVDVKLQELRGRSPVLSSLLYDEQTWRRSGGRRASSRADLPPR